MERILLTPGPVHVAGSRYLLVEEMHHRSDSFRLLMRETCSFLAEILGTSGRVAVISSSGTGAMETAVANFTSGKDKALVVSAGKFGERWAEILTCHGRGVKVHRLIPEESIDVEGIAGLIVEEHPDVIFLTHVESSTGMLLPLRELMDLIKGKKPLVIVDAVASLGVEEISMDEWGMDVVVGASQKAFSVPPGLGIVAFGERAEEKMKEVHSKGYYFDLEKYLDEAAVGDPPFTPAIPLVQMMHESLRLFRSIGLDRMMERHIVLSNSFYAGMSALGFEVLSRNPSRAVHVLRVPGGVVEGTNLPALIEDRTGFVVADGQGEYRGKVISAKDGCSRNGARYQHRRGAR